MSKTNVVGAIKVEPEEEFEWLIKSLKKVFFIWIDNYNILIIINQNEHM